MLIPTKSQIRKWYKQSGCEVIIHKDGHVEFRNPNEDQWRDGRYVEEYRSSDDTGSDIHIGR